MKKFIFFLASVLLLCNCEEQDSIISSNNIVTAEIDSELTKISMEDDGRFVWSSNDKIWLSSTKGNVEGVLSIGAESSKATFSYGPYILKGSAVYPYGHHQISEKELIIDIPFVYDLGSTKYTSKTNVAMYAVEEGRILKFRLLAGVMKFDFKDAPEGTSQFKVTFDKKVNGKFKVDLEHESPIMSTEETTDDAEKTITLNFTPLDQTRSLELYVPLPAGIYNSIEFELNAGAQNVYTDSYKKPQIVNRRDVILMPTISLNGIIDETPEGTGPDPVPATDDYIDEYGINHGEGVEIDGVVWAPVNCGYLAKNYRWGKLYQWGRKYGQGYSGALYDKYWNKTGEVSDVTVPQIADGPVSLAVGQSEMNKDVVFSDETSSFDWLSLHDDKLWNKGTEEYPVKTEYDPCPPGWRVPTYKELNNLYQNHSSWTENIIGQLGYWFSGTTPYSSSDSRLFLPAAGWRDVDCVANYRGISGMYWSSSCVEDSSLSYYLGFYDGDEEIAKTYRESGLSVRCVKE